MGTDPHDGAASSRSPRSPVPSQQSKAASADDSVNEVSVQSSACSEERFPSRKDSAQAVERSKRGDEDEEVKQEHEHNEEPTAFLVVVMEDGDETENDEEMELMVGGYQQVPVHSTPRSRDDQEAHGPSEHHSKLPIISSPVSTASFTSSSQIELPEDELLLQAAVARAADFADSSVPKSSVWNAIASSTGGARVLDGYAAKTRVMWLQRVWLDKRHTMHPQLTDNLTQLIEQYREAKRSTRKSSGPKKRKQRVVFDKRKLLMDQDPLVDVNLDQEQDDAQVIYPSVSTKSKRQPVICPDLEENVLRIVLLHAPNLLKAEAKIDVWNTIAEGSRGRYATGESARARTAWLCKVLKKSDHVEHANITPTLREMLVEFQKFEPSPHRRTIYKRSVKENEDPVTQNEALLCELLRVRPFNARQEQIVPAWERTAAALHNTPWGRAVFPTAKACAMQMKRLLFAIRHPNRPSNVQLPDRQVTMVTLVDTLMKMRWPRVEEKLTDKHRQLLEQIDQVLRTQRGNRHEGDIQDAASDSEDDCADKDEAIEKPKSRGRKRKQRPQEPLSSISPHNKTPRLHLRQNRALEIEVGTPQAFHSDEMKKSRSDVAMCRAEINLQRESFEYERREHRQEWRSWMEMLNEEREAHKREMAAVFEALKSEQEGRKSEFEAMVDLVTRLTSQRQTHE